MSRLTSCQRKSGSFPMDLQDCQCCRHITLCSPISTKPQCSFLQAMLYSGMNGIGLALVVPCVQSLIADYTPADKRGAAFGVLYFTGALGEHPNNPKP